MECIVQQNRLSHCASCVDHVGSHSQFTALETNMTNIPDRENVETRLSDLEQLERSFRYQFTARTCVAWLIFALGILFAMMSVGCIVQHFVDRTMPWGRDPVRDVLEPLTWAVNATLAFVASRSIFRSKSLIAVVMLAIFIIEIFVMGSIYGF